MAKKGKKKKRLQEGAESEILKKLAKYGPSHMYPFHEVKSRRYIASRGTVYRAKKSLRRDGFIRLKRTVEHPGKDTKIFRLTFRGLHYCLLKGLVNVKDAAKTMGRHGIKLPPLPGTEFIEANPKFRYLKGVVDLFRYEDLPKVAKEWVGLFPLDFFSRLKALSFEQYKTRVEYNGLIYMGIFANIPVSIFLNPDKHKIVMTETKYMWPYFRKVWKNLLLLQREIEDLF